MRTAHTIYTCSLIKIFIRAMHYYGAYVKSGSRLPPPSKRGDFGDQDRRYRFKTM